MAYRAKTCYSASHGGLSHIDVGLGNVILMQRVLSAAYEPCLLSEHSAFWVKIDVVAQETRLLWQINPFWLTLLPSLDGIPSASGEFLRFDRGSARAAVVWDSLNAFLRGMSHSKDF